MDNTARETPPASPRSLLRRVARFLFRCCQFVLLLIAFYLLIALAGLIPVNNDFEPTPGGVEVIVTSGAYHADLVLPISNEVVDWRKHFPAGEFKGDVSRATRVAFGWGNKEFYVDAPTWDDVTVGIMCRALLWPSATCMHVEMWYESYIPDDAGRTRISHEQYRRLADHILGSFRRDDQGRFLLIENGAFGNHDVFYHGLGSYHAFNTCNCWVGRGLKTAGIRTGWFTPLPKTVSAYMSAAEIK